MTSFSSSSTFLKAYFPPGLVEYFEADSRERYIIYDNSADHPSLPEHAAWQKLRAEFSIAIRLCKELGIPYKLAYSNSIYVEDETQMTILPPRGPNMLCSALIDCAAYVRSKKTSVSVLVFTRGNAPVDGKLYNALLTFNDLPVTVTVNLYDAVLSKDTRKVRRYDLEYEWYTLLNKQILPEEVYRFPLKLLTNWDVDDYRRAKYHDREDAITFHNGHPLHLAQQFGLQLPIRKGLFYYGTIMDREELDQLFRMICGTKLMSEASMEGTLEKLVLFLEKKLQPTSVNQSCSYNEYFRLLPWFAYDGRDSDEDVEQENEYGDSREEEEEEVEEEVETKWCCCFFLLPCC